jgi:O-acetyl-ADP-ribose deacetylase (regulator of RNase III)/uncharacterized protein YwgA
VVEIVAEGDLFKSKTQTWVNTVNTVGVMGKGIALGFKRRFPEMFKDYVRRCDEGLVQLGRPYLFKREVEPWVLNFPTKEHWRQAARLDAIVQGLEYLEKHYQEWGIRSLAVPPLGCGEGQLEWRVVGPTLFRHLSRLSIPVELFAPFGTPHDELQPAYLEQLSLALDEDPEEGVFAPSSRIPVGWIALVAALDEIESDKFHWPIGRTGLQKLAYFAEAAGIDTDLTWEKGSYGPFARDAKPMLAKLVNNGLLVERRLGRMFNVQVGPTFDDAKRGYADDLDNYAEAIHRVADLFRRFQTRQAEVAATVHLVASELASSRQESPWEAEVYEEVQRWKARRDPPFKDREIADAVRHLALLGWLDLRLSTELEVDEADDLVGSGEFA